MRTVTTCTCLLLVVLAAAGTVRAEQSFDPQARAKTIAPFIDETTIAIVHADLSRIRPDAFFPLAIEYLDRGTAKVDDIVTHTFPLTEFNRAFQVVENKDEAIKVVVVP